MEHVVNKDREINLVAPVGDPPDIDIVRGASKESPVAISYRVALPPGFQHTTRDHVVRIVVTGCIDSDLQIGTPTLDLSATAQLLRLRLDDHGEIRSAKRHTYSLAVRVVPSHNWLGSGQIGERADH